MDFDNLGLSSDEFWDLGKYIQSKLELEGYIGEIKNIVKGAFHGNIRFLGLLFQNGLSGYQEEKILIQLDSEAQGFEFKSELYFLNKFDIFTTIPIASKSLLFAQKFYFEQKKK